MGQCVALRALLLAFFDRPSVLAHRELSVQSDVLGRDTLCEALDRLANVPVAQGAPVTRHYQPCANPVTIRSDQLLGDLDVCEVQDSLLLGGQGDVGRRREGQRSGETTCARAAGKPQVTEIWLMA